MRPIDADELLKDARLDKAISACLADIFDIQELVNAQPTIKAVPVVYAEWENVGDNEDDLCFRCTNCKSEYSCEIDMRQFAKHCPECGADMLKGGAK